MELYVKEPLAGILDATSYKVRLLYHIAFNANHVILVFCKYIMVKIGCISYRIFITEHKRSLMKKITGKKVK